MYNNTDICVAAGMSFSEAVVFTPEGLAKHFKNYVNGKEGFILFCQGKFAWRAPNADLVRFHFCPNTGVKIDWDEVLNYGLSFFTNE